MGLPVPCTCCGSVLTACIYVTGPWSLTCFMVSQEFCGLGRETQSSDDTVTPVLFVWEACELCAQYRLRGDPKPLCRPFVPLLYCATTMGATLSISWISDVCLSKEGQSWLRRVCVCLLLGEECLISPSVNTCKHTSPERKRNHLLTWAATVFGFLPPGGSD